MEDLLERVALPGACLNHKLKYYSYRMINTPISSGALDHSVPPAVPLSNLGSAAWFCLNNMETAYLLSNIMLELSNPTCMLKFQSPLSHSFCMAVFTSRTVSTVGTSLGIGLPENNEQRWKLIGLRGAAT